MAIAWFILSLVFFVAGCICWWRVAVLFDRAKRQLEEAEVEHNAAEWYWAKSRSNRRKG
jgi:uncharacterized membrane protein